MVLRMSSFLQLKYFLQDSTWNSFKYGKSIRNQKIDGFYSPLRRFCPNSCLSFSQDLMETGSYNNTNNIESECLLYCFGELIKKDLDCFKTS